MMPHPNLLPSHLPQLAYEQSGLQASGREPGPAKAGSCNLRQINLVSLGLRRLIYKTGGNIIR